jgi:hypothetical protein
MSRVSRLRDLVRSFVAWSLLWSPTLAFGTEPMLVQQIGEVSSAVAGAVAAEVNVVPLSPEIDARTTPIIVAPGKGFVLEDRPGEVGGLRPAERRAIRQAYDAGQTILVLHASVHDIEALHVLVEEGVTHRSSSDPAVLAYALRQQSDIPTVRVVHNLRPGLPAPGGIGPDFEDEGALQRPLEIIISELIQPPVVGPAPPTIERGAERELEPDPGANRHHHLDVQRHLQHASRHLRAALMPGTRITISSTPAVTGLPPRQRPVPRAQKRIKYTSIPAPMLLTLL